MADATDELEGFRAEARTWLEENFPPSLAGRAAELMRVEIIDSAEGEALAWGKCLGAKGWATPTWPAAYGGGGLSQLQAQVLNQELDRAGAFNPLVRTTGMGITMVGPTILEYGTEKQKQKPHPADLPGRSLLGAWLLRAQRRARTSPRWRRARRTPGTTGW